MSLILCTILAFADPAAGSSASAGTPRQNIPQPVEQGVGDVNPLSQSQRVLPVDLFVPTRFEKVYRLEDVIRRGDAAAAPGNSSRPTGFVRFSGGVAAVFPFSTYEPTPRGKVATIPAGTVFHLDLRPARPGDVNFSESATPPAFNAASGPLMSTPRARSLAASEQAAETTHHVSAAMERPAAVATSQRRDDVPRTLSRGGEVSKLAGPKAPKDASVAQASVVTDSGASQPPRLQRLTPWSEGALRERVLDGLIDELVAPAVPGVLR